MIVDLSGIREQNGEAIQSLGDFGYMRWITNLDFRF